MTQDIRYRRNDQPGNQTPRKTGHSSVPGGVDMFHLLEASATTVEDSSLVLLRDSLLFLARKYPDHSRSISQLVSFIELLMHLPDPLCVAG